MDPDEPCSPRNNSDATVGIGVLNGAIVCYGSCVMGNTPVHVREEGNRYEALPHTTALQPMDERIRLCHGSP